MAENRYGPIDLASKHWPGASQWIQMLDITPGWFPNWKVLNTDHPVQRIACNIDMREPLTQALANIRGQGLQHLLETYDGCYAIRTVRGANFISTHSYGLAIDLNAGSNKLGQASGGFFDTPAGPVFVKCFLDAGFDWGGNFERCDPMHFSFAWEG